MLPPLLFRFQHIFGPVTLHVRPGRRINMSNMKTKFSLWKRIKCFASTSRTRNLKSQQLAVILSLCLRNARAEKSHIIVTPSFPKAHFSKCSPSPRKAGVFKFLRCIVHGAYVINSFTFLRFQNVFQRFILVHLTGVGTRDGSTGASEVICHAANRIQFSASLARFRRLIHLLKTI